MEPAKPRKWTVEETKLLIELAQRKEKSASDGARDWTSHRLRQTTRSRIGYSLCRRAGVRGSFNSPTRSTHPGRGAFIRGWEGGAWPLKVGSNVTADGSIAVCA